VRIFGIWVETASFRYASSEQPVVLEFNLIAVFLPSSLAVKSITVAVQAISVISISVLADVCQYPEHQASCLHD